MSIPTPLTLRRLVINAAAVLLLLVAVIGAAGADPQPAKTFKSPPAIPPAAAGAGYGALPISFVPNAGQSDASVRYQAHAMGGELFFTDAAVVLSLPAAAGGQPTRNRSVVNLRFEGVDNARRWVHADPLVGKVNYLIGNNPAGWHTDLPTFGSIIYEKLYPGIDLRYDGTQGALKGTYTLAPGADPAQIRWRYEGAASSQVDQTTGDLILTLAGLSTLIEKAPDAWQMVNGVKVTVPAAYARQADGSLGFALGGYDPRLALTIDPFLIYSTYLGGSLFDGAKSMAIDFAGYAYVTGETFSTNFPTGSPLYNALNGSSDAFVVKINPSGTALVYATYLGGSDREDDFGLERAGGIAVDSFGNAYVTGCTNSANFPTVNPIRAFSGPSNNCDVYVSKLNPAGDGLVYSTFYGGSSADAANAIAVDDLGAVYIAGDAGVGFPENPFTSSGHAFVLKINPAGSAVLFSYFLGGDGHEYATDIAIDSAHNIFVVGNTYSSDFPITLNAVQRTFGGGISSPYDAFVTKIRADGLGLLYSTYLGGSKTDQASGIALDDLGNAYITGVTQSLDFPLQDAYQPVYGGGSGDAFVTKLNPTGTAWVYSTYLGGNDEENNNTGHGPYGAITVDSSYRATVVGYTRSTNFPTLNSFRNGQSGTSFAFTTRFNAAGSALVFSTLIGARSGGSNNTYATDVAVDAQGVVYVVGETNAANLPTLTSIQSTYGGLYDAFVTKFDPNNKAFLPLTVKSSPPAATLTVKSPNGSEQWQPGTAHTITWTQSGLTGSVTLELYEGASLVGTVGTASASAGSFSWAIPGLQPAGNDYQIRISQGLVEDYSDASFFIRPIRKYDLVGSWPSGVSSLNSDTSAWNLITSSPASQVAVGDMDGDGKADIVACFPASGLWVKYSSTGLWQFISSPPTSIAVGDFNGDGKADLAGIWGGVIWIRDSATGSWTAGPAGANLLAAGDVNGDDKADLVANYPATGVWVQYSASGAWSNLTPDPATAIAVGDFNGDGKADLVVIWNNIVWIKYTNGSWAPGPADATLITAGDLNGDGNADLVVNYPTTGVWVQYSATGAWSNLTTSPATWIATGVLR